MKKITIKGISINELSYPLPRPVEVDKGDPKFDVWNTMMAMRIEWQKDYDELQKLKVIEEELGIDLVTLFKALKDGIYAVVPDYDGPSIQFFESYKLQLDIYSKVIDIHDDALACVLIIVYGKTWALTKEELYEQRQ